MIPVRALVLLAGVGLLTGPFLLPRLAAYLETRPEYSTAHVEHLRHGLVIFLSNPVFGVGLNNSSVVRPFVLRQALTAEESQVPVHSGYLLLLGETGILGFSLCAGFFLLVGIEAFRRSGSADPYTRTFAVGTFGAYAAMSVHMMTDYLGTEAFYAMIWLYAGLIVASRRWELPPARPGERWHPPAPSRDRSRRGEARIIRVQHGQPP